MSEDLMQPVKALQLGIGLAQAWVDYSREFAGDPGAEELEAEAEQAVDTMVAVLNQVLPVSKYRVFVTLITPAKEKYEFTVCATAMIDVRMGILGASVAICDAHVIIFEITQGGQGKVVSMYQGKSKSKAWLDWLKSLSVN